MTGNKKNISPGLYFPLVRENMTFESIIIYSAVVKGVLRHKAEVNEDGFLTRDQIFTAFAECGHWAADSKLSTVTGYQ